MSNQKKVVPTKRREKVLAAILGVILILFMAGMMSLGQWGYGIFCGLLAGALFAKAL